MSSDLTEPVMLVGCGSMARAYADVLKDLEVPLVVVGRGEESARLFHQETGIKPHTGGLEAYLANGAFPSRAISAVDVPNLDNSVHVLLNNGVRDILVEKPAGLTPQAVADIADEAERFDARVSVAYNRRYYESVREARRLVDDAGGASSCRFDFTERADLVSELDTDARTKRGWLYANSTHVIDLAFFLVGFPTVLSAQVSGGLKWHPEGALFAGHGETTTGASFSYAADWSGPGRWGVEVVTPQHKLILQPMEELRIQTAGSFEVKKVSQEDSLDQRFKPGVFRQTRAFLTGEDNAALLGLREHATHMNLYAKILKGTCGREAF